MNQVNSAKKAQGLSINVILIAVIGLIVVVVLIAIFSGVIKDDFIPFKEGITECKEPSYCSSNAACEDGGTPVKLGCDEETDPGEWCCVIDE